MCPAFSAHFNHSFIQPRTLCSPALPKISSLGGGDTIFVLFPKTAPKILLTARIN